METKIPVYPPYNPLDKRNIGNSIAEKLMQSELHPLPPEPFIAAGVYAIYYCGSMVCYRKLVEANREAVRYPIYIGKAVPKGARKGGNVDGVNPGKALFERLKEHANSVCAAENLDIKDFSCRFLSVDDIWIPLTETLMIERFQPVWNRLLDGFGNHNPGKGRHKGRISLWDCVHPGRGWVKTLEPCQESRDVLEERIRAYLDEKMPT